MRAVIGAACVLVLAGCTGASQVQCLDDADCSRFAGGSCTTAPTGHRWCAYPDVACEGGQRWSDQDVGDGLAGTCVGELPPDPGDGGITCAAGTITCTSDTYVECSTAGEVVRSVHCALGCDPIAARCIDVDPSNGLAAQLDLLTATDPAVVFSGLSTIDTTTGMVFVGPTSIDLPNELVGNIRVFRLKSLEIQDTLRITGTPAIAFVVDGDVTIRGLIDVSARGTAGGPGRATTTCFGGTAQGGGGGGGGGRFDDGGRGGTGSGATGGVGGVMLRDGALEPLVGGCAGGGGAGSITNPGGPGGGGGGAIQIVSRTTIALVDSGRIDASGGGGATAATPISFGDAAGTGGGAGGGVLLEAPQTVFDGAGVVISTKGGGGGGATPEGVVRAGADGGTTSTAATGGAFGSGYASGGLGGTHESTPSPGASDTDGPGGGGGGSVGQARFNNRAGAINPQNGAAIFSRRSSSLLRTRLVP